MHLTRSHSHSRLDFLFSDRAIRMVRKRLADRLVLGTRFVFHHVHFVYLAHCKRYLPNPASHARNGSAHLTPHPIPSTSTQTSPCTPSASSQHSPHPPRHPQRPIPPPLPGPRNASRRSRPPPGSIYVRTPRTFPPWKGRRVVAVLGYTRRGGAVYEYCGRATGRRGGCIGGF